MSTMKLPGGGALAALDMGTGKSRLLVDLVQNTGMMRTLILCPRNVVRVWPNQFDLYSRGIDVMALPDNKSVAQKAEVARDFLRKATGPHVLIAGYESAWRPPLGPTIGKHGQITDYGVLMDAGFDFLGADEIQALKGPESKVGQFGRRLAEQTMFRLGLSGTPAPQSPLDYWGVMGVVDPDWLGGMSYRQFRQHYAVIERRSAPNGREFDMVVGYKNMDELAELVNARTIRVRKTDVLDLPPTMHNPRYGTLTPRGQRAYETMMDEFVAQVSDGTLVAQNAAVRLLRLQQITSGYLPDPDTNNATRIDTSKRELLAEVLEELPVREPVVVFARFHHDLAEIEAVAKGQGRRYGEVSGRRRDLTDKGTMPDSIDLMGVQIQSGGVGLDFTRSAHAIYYSVGFSVGQYEQSLARLDRPGQTRSVTYTHLIMANTIEETVLYPALKEGADLIEAVLGHISAR